MLYLIILNKILKLKSDVYKHNWFESRYDILNESAGALSNMLSLET